MLTPHQLAWALRRANVEAIAGRADVCTKTVYRIRRKPEGLRVRTLLVLSSALEAEAPSLFIEAQRQPREVVAIAEPAEAA